MKSELPMFGDQRGSILVPSLIMAPVAAGGIWYQISAWQAIAQRSSMQVAADAIAGGGATWLSAGLNLLATINVAMSLLLMVFVGIRAVELLCAAAAIVLVAASLFTLNPVWGYWASRAAQLGRNALNLERRVAPTIMRILNGATVGERAVAAVFPYISAGLSPTYGATGGGSNGFGAAASFSLMPTRIDQGLSGLTGGNAAPGSLTSSLAAPTRMGTIGAESSHSNALSAVRRALPARAQAFVDGNWLGSLPVEEEDYSGLCARAAGDWATFPWVRDLPFVDAMGTVLGFIGGNFTAVLCQPLSETVEGMREAAQEALEDEVDQVARDASDRYVGQRCSPGNTNLHMCQNNAREDFNREERTRVRRNARNSAEERNNRQLRQLEEQNRQTQNATGTIKTAKVWSFLSDDAVAHNGTSNVFLESWSAYVDVDGRPRGFRVRLPTVGTPGAGAVPVVDLPTVEGFQVNASSAKAAAYFDCDTEDFMQRETDASGIHGCTDNAMWRPGGWRWDLVVDRSALQELGSSVQQAGVGYLANTAGQLMQNIVGRLGGLVQRGLTAGRPGQGDFSGAPDVWTEDAANFLSLLRGRIATSSRDADFNTHLGPGQSHGLDWWVGDQVSNGLDGVLSPLTDPYLR